MAKYGNILSVFNTDDNGHLQIESVLTKNLTEFTRFQNTYYIKTNSKVNTTDVIKDLKSTNIDIIFFHNHISDSSAIKSNNINNEIITNIIKIFK